MISQFFRMELFHQIEYDGDWHICAMRIRVVENRIVRGGRDYNNILHYKVSSTLDVKY